MVGRLLGAELRRATVDTGSRRTHCRWCAHAHRWWRAAVRYGAHGWRVTELGAGGDAASVMCADGESLVLGVDVVALRFGVGFAHSDGATGADTAGCDATRTIAEDVAL